MLSRTERKALASVLGTVRDRWERDTYPSTRRTTDGRMSFTWDAPSQTMRIQVKERRAWDEVATVRIDSLTQGLDVLAGLELIPANMSSAYERGWYIGRALLTLERHSPDLLREAA